MTSFEAPKAWTWTDARGLLFEATTAPDRLLTTDLGKPRTPEELQDFVMQQALRESCERVATLLNEAGLSLEDVQHLDPNRHRVNQVGKYLESDFL